ncbi:MAG: NAD-dependent succinate-semialdehyde dehydrogenase [Neisseriaceae bacterium]|nr:NAD-dependent succinate-semialdehyde dehydrogenase [Neisseriaceae bacterium]
MWINGQWRLADQRFSVHNPATGAWLGEVGEATAADIDAAIAAAHQAFPAWSRTNAYERARLLHEAHRLMLAQKNELAELMSKEQGKPLKAALNEVQYGADFLSWYAEEAKRIYGETIPSARDNQRFLVQYQAVGVVGAITPWNYPISMITRKLAPALAAGCTVVLKPAESTPLCAVAMMKIFAAAGFPDGVINLLTVSDPTAVGEAFCQDPRVRKLTFTGSTAVGKKLNALAGAHLKRVSLELGGHAPAIVCADADPVHAAKGLALVKFLNTGQACISPNRLFVHETMMAPFVAELVKRASALKAGPGLIAGNSIGPLINEAALNKVDAQVQDALAKGATLWCGGKRLLADGLDQGYFYAPTVLSGITEDMRIYREETFGPVAAVMAFDSDEAVLQQANDTEYGLAAYVYTEQLARSMRFFEGLRFGIVGLNDINPTSAAAPFGGMQHSGLGREGGRAGIFEYLDTKLAGMVV